MTETSSLANKPIQ